MNAVMFLLGVFIGGTSMNLVHTHFNHKNSLGSFKLPPVDPRHCGKSYVVCDGDIGEYCNPSGMGCGEDRELYRGKN